MTSSDKLKNFKILKNLSKNKLQISEKIEEL